MATLGQEGNQTRTRCHEICQVRISTCLLFLIRSIGIQNIPGSGLRQLWNHAQGHSLGQNDNLIKNYYSKDTDEVYLFYPICFAFISCKRDAFSKRGDRFLLWTR